MEVGEGALDDQDPKSPGEVLGFFAVDGILTEDTCGAASVGAPDQWSFEVKLSRDRGTLYWLNGREAIVGDIDESGAFAFSTRLEQVLSMPRGAFDGCTLVRSDSARGALSSSAASLRAELIYAFSAKRGSDCSEAQGADGLPLPLPCSVSYGLRGARAP